MASVADEQGLDETRVRALGVLSDADLAVVLSRATLFVYPSIAEGFGLPVLEAMHFGVPVVHSDDPALMEVAADAGVAVERTDAKNYPERLALAMSSVLADTGCASGCPWPAATAPVPSAGATRPSASGLCTPTSERPGRAAATSRW